MAWYSWIILIILILGVLYATYVFWQAMDIKGWIFEGKYGFILCLPKTIFYLVCAAVVGTACLFILLGAFIPRARHQEED